MKKLTILILILIVSTNCFAQNWIHTDSITANKETLQKAAVWSTQNLTNVIVVNNIIYGSHTFKLQSGEVKFTFIMKLNEENEKFFITMENFNHFDTQYEGRTNPNGKGSNYNYVDYSGGNLSKENPKTKKLSEKQWKAIKSETDRLIKEFANNLIKHINS